MIPQKIPTKDARCGYPVRGAAAARPTPERTSGIDPNVCAEYARIILKSVMNLGLRAGMPMHVLRGLHRTCAMANAWGAAHRTCSCGKRAPRIRLDGV